MSAQSELERNAQLVIAHFEAFVNQKDLDAIDRNMTPGFRDHDGPGGAEVDRAADRDMMAGMHQRFPDLHVEVKDVVAQGDRVVVRNVWTCTDTRTRQKMEFHGFVMWRIEGGKIAERWATVTPLQAVKARTLEW